MRARSVSLEGRPGASAFGLDAREETLAGPRAEPALELGRELGEREAGTLELGERVLERLSAGERGEERVLRARELHAPHAAVLTEDDEPGGLPSRRRAVLVVLERLVPGVDR